MATLRGRNAKVTLAAETIAEQANWTMTRTSESIDTTAFGSSWAKSDVGFLKWVGHCEGYLDITDTSGQIQLESDFEAGSLINTIRFYVDAASYYVPDTTTDANAGCRITSLDIAADKGDVVKVSFDFEGSGPIALV